MCFSNSIGTIGYLSISIYLSIYLSIIYLSVYLSSIYLIYASTIYLSRERGRERKKNNLVQSFHQKSQRLGMVADIVIPALSEFKARLGYIMSSDLA
jgi:hypothetical protein